MENDDINQYPLSIMDVTVLKDIMQLTKRGLNPLTSHGISKIYETQEKEVFDTLSRLEDNDLVTQKSLNDGDIAFVMTKRQCFNVLRIFYRFNDVTTSICEMNIDDIAHISRTYRQIEQHLQHHNIQGYDLSIDDVRVLRLIIQLSIEGFDATITELHERLLSIGNVDKLTLILNRLLDYDLINYDNNNSSYNILNYQIQKATHIVSDVHQMLNRNIL